MKTVTRLVLGLLALGLSSVGLLAAATPAHAADFYRYWSYFEVQDGSYTYAKKGVGDTRPADGSIQAFRYSASAENSPNLPRIDLTQATFDAVCGDDDADSGEKLVAVLIDYGVEQDADGQQIPEAQAECADVPQNATTLQVLQDVGKARTQSSSFGVLLCAIDGYPARGCADQKTSTPTPKDSSFLPVELEGATTSPSATDSSSPTASPTGSNSALPQGPGQDNQQDTEQGRGSSAWPYVAVAVVFFGLVGGALYLVRKRNRA